MPKAQAEVLAGYYASLLNDSIAILNDSIATLKDSTANKDDIIRLEEKIKHSQQLLEEKIKQSEQRLWIRMLVGQIASVGLIITALQYWS